MLPLNSSALSCWTRGRPVLSGALILLPLPAPDAGTEFCTHGKQLKGNNDLLTLTRPAAIYDIHMQVREERIRTGGSRRFTCTTMGGGEDGGGGAVYAFEWTLSLRWKVQA